MGTRTFLNQNTGKLEYVDPNDPLLLEAAKAQEDSAIEAAAAADAEARAQQVEADRRAYEEARHQEQLQQAAQLAAQAEAAQRQQTSDLAIGAQNQQVSQEAPTVQIDTAGPEGSTAGTKSKRRAQFFGSYSSGVTI